MEQKRMIAELERLRDASANQSADCLAWIELWTVLITMTEGTK